MAEMVIHRDRIPDIGALKGLCPFGAIIAEPDRVAITAACRMCKLCIKNGPPGAFELVKDDADLVDKRKWRGIAVYIDQTGGEVHPVSLELVGKARELAAKISHPVYAVLIGNALSAQAVSLLRYGIDRIYLYEHPALEHFRIEPYTAVFEDFIRRSTPSVVLVGGTTIGRSLAPRTAARFRTGLTADCTSLDIQDSTDLDQIRPAFGGNIMAHIRTPRHRPQFATVRYKIFSAPTPVAAPTGQIIAVAPTAAMLQSRIDVLATHRKEPVRNIEDADVLVVAGHGLQRSDRMVWLEQIAAQLGGMLGGTRPVIEAGWLEPRRQIGLSGRTVKPKLIITCAVSGSIQFVAGMRGAERIIAINTDPNAPVFKVAHTAIVGDVCEVLPSLLKKMKGG